jgi:heme-degrading monooxygenase HmoA
MSSPAQKTSPPFIEHGEDSMPRPNNQVMTARIWRGAVRREDGDAYAEYMEGTGVAGYVQTPGNIAALMLRRDNGEQSEFVMVTLWESMDAVRAFAGEEPDKAVFYPEDDRFLVERDLQVSHFQVISASGIAAGG